ncbi:MAG: DUF2179 domain-containing protein [Bacteroidia bacterium]|nr:DUF2179 domain-containing protein [Bacteroidota bacterium]MBL0072084.1 DUF2179 domain-containing protein [Bacteroidota bacterium]MBP9081785.1 DUF2179 domain-containing protein [Bacteroidia bacterium]
MTISAEFLQSDLFNWAILPLLIFIARTCDVTLATLRNIFIARNIKKIVPLLGFFEVLIWLVAVSQTINNLHNIACYIGFAGGYSMGIFVGITIEGKLALGKQVVRIITNQDTTSLVAAMSAANMGVTILDGNGAKGPVKVIFTTLKRRDVQLADQLINKHTPNAFYTIEDIRNSNQGVFREKQESKFSFLKMLLPGGSAA